MSATPGASRIRMGQFREMRNGIPGIHGILESATCRS
jgi:hypothetical protein